MSNKKTRTFDRDAKLLQGVIDSIVYVPAEHAPDGKPCLLIPILALSSLLVSMATRRLDALGIDVHPENERMFGVDMSFVSAEHPEHGRIDAIRYSLPEGLTEEDLARLEPKGSG